MPRSKPSYPPEFTAEAVRLVGSGDRSLTRIAKDLGVADQTLRSWVQHAESGDGGRDATDSLDLLGRAQDRLDAIQGHMALVTGTGVSVAAG